MLTCKRVECGHNGMITADEPLCALVAYGCVTEPEIDECGQCRSYAPYCCARNGYTHDFFMRVRHKPFEGRGSINPIFLNRVLCHGGFRLTYSETIRMYTKEDMRRRPSEILLYEERTGLCARLDDFTRVVSEDRAAVEDYFERYLARCGSIFSLPEMSALDAEARDDMRAYAELG